MEIKTLSTNERAVMELLWEHGSLSNMEILEHIGEGDGWSRHTVKSYTSRMADKGLIRIHRISARRTSFSPAIAKEKYLARLTSSHLRENYSSLTYMITGLINNDDITQAEIDELEQLLKKHKGE